LLPERRTGHGSTRRAERARPRREGAPRGVAPALSSPSPRAPRSPPRSGPAAWQNPITCGSIAPMSTHGASGGRSPVFGDLANRSRGGRHIKLGAAIVVGLVVALIVVGIMHGQRVAEWAPVSVVDSHEPLQELPVRVAQGDEPVEPAHTYDAVLDVSSVKALV